MGKNSAIEWTDNSWNPWRGCRKVSQGCKNCYMFRDQIRYGRDPKQIVRAAPATFNAPLKWKNPAMVFTCSWSDFFIEDADDWRGDAWDIIRQTPHLTYQILTKRPENIADRLPADWGSGWPNVWLGVSVENQPAADERIPAILRIPAWIRFLSMEPLLGAVDLSGKTVQSVWIDSEYANLDPGLGEIVETEGWPIHWAIIGGESGPGAREFKMEWAGNIVNQCKRAGVPVFVKQMGDYATHDGDRVHGLGPKGKDMDKWPGWLAVREFPQVANNER